MITIYSGYITQLRFFPNSTTTNPRFENHIFGDLGFRKRQLVHCHTRPKGINWAGTQFSI